MRRYGYKATKKAPKPITVKAVKIDADSLLKAYEYSALSETLGLRLALEWYQQNITFLLYGKALDTDQQKTYSRAVKAQELGNSSTMEGEQSQAFRTALRQYDKLFGAAHTLPSVDTAVQTMTDKPSKRVEAVKTVLDTLNKAFDNAVKFTLTLNPDREVVDKEFHLPLAELEAATTSTPLHLALTEAPNVAQALSIVYQDGSPVLDGAAYMENLPKILTGIAHWATTLSNIKPISTPAPKTREPRATKVQSTTQPTNGIKPPDTYSVLKMHNWKKSKATVPAGVRYIWDHQVHGTIIQYLDGTYTHTQSGHTLKSGGRGLKGYTKGLGA